MEKYNLIPEQLLREGTLLETHFFQPKPIAETDILRVHTSDYWTRLRDQKLSPAEMRRTGFPHDLDLVFRERVIMQGTLDCALLALKNGVSLNVSGGTHHAFSCRGEGFCLLNDMALAAQYLLDHQLARQILIVDLDVHQGNGTASIFENDPRVFTFSMHCAGNFPFHREPSDLDVDLAPGTQDSEYLEILRRNLDPLMDRLRPDLVFFQSGVDVLETDLLGKLRLSRRGCLERDRLVFKLCHSGRVPVVASMGGGYSALLRDVVEAHCNTFRQAVEIWF